LYVNAGKSVEVQVVVVDATTRWGSVMSMKVVVMPLHRQLADGNNNSPRYMNNNSLQQKREEALLLCVLPFRCNHSAPSR
jgi:ubiquitin-protein ligase